MRKTYMLMAFLAVAGILFFGINYASAEKEHGSCQMRFEKYDIDRDGVISREEYHVTYNEGQYMGTVPTPSGTPAFVQFSYLDREDKGYLTLRDFCAGARY